MSKPNKRRRELNRLNRNRADLTEITAKETDERRSFKGFESYYEITRKGDVFSKRLKRFIKHKFNPHNDSTYIKFNISGKTRSFGVGEAIAETWLSATDIENIIKKIPEDINPIEPAKYAGLIDVIAKDYGLPSSVFFYILNKKSHD